MNSRRCNRSILSVCGLCAGLALAELGASPCISQESASSHPSSAVQQQSFSSPEAATDALLQAASPFDPQKLETILGPDGHDLVFSQDPVLDKEKAEAFAARAREKKRVTVNPKRPGVATLFVGDEEWPMPIPIVERDGRWYFDSKKGRLEVLYRRIGENELTVIDLCRGYVEAQKEYAQEQHDNSGINQYAQRVISTPGKHDGLAWQNADGTWGGPVGDVIAKAIDEGYPSSPKPFHGYYFKILKGQGPSAPLGKIDFVIEDVMIGGFAFVAVPAQYQVTGVNTFLVGSDGVVYQKILGPDSLKIVQEMELYNPDRTWTRVK